MDKILISYYEDSLGKIIRFDFNSKEQLIFYKKIIDELANGKKEQVCFDNLDNFDMLNEVKIVFKKNSYSFIEKEKKKTNAFIIYQNKENLVTHSYLLEPLIKKNSPGHQYIEFDNFMVMLSYKEN